MTCECCGGPAHPATGHAMSATFMLCGICAGRICAGRFWAWVIAHTRDRPAGRRQSKRAVGAIGFYTAAATSIRADADKEDA